MIPPRHVRPVRLAWALQRTAPSRPLSVSAAVRQANTAGSPPPQPPLLSSVSSISSTRGPSKLRAWAIASSLGLVLFGGYYYATDTRASFHRIIVPRLLRVLYPDAEEAHHFGTQSLKVLYQFGLHPRDRTERDGDANSLAVRVFADAAGGVALNNPIGISAGLDKDADIPDALFELGAAVVEVGGCTPRPQPGNPRPRVFRVPSIEGFVNRYGLNSIGADALAYRLRARVNRFCHENGKQKLTEAGVISGKAGVPPGSLKPGRLLLVQIAKNKDTDEHDVQAVADDYTYCVRRLAPYADVLVVNVSSPNTPGLRELQAVEPLTKILAAVVKEARSTTKGIRAPPRVMVKVSPDEDEDIQVDGICEAIQASGVDGVIVGNTTKRRSGLVPGKLQLPGRELRNLYETGGFSGPALFNRTLSLVTKYKQRLDSQSYATDTATNDGPSQKTIFASGGVTTGEDAQKLLNAGASVAMVYTGLVYGGAGTITRIKQQMRGELSKP